MCAFRNRVGVMLYGGTEEGYDGAEAAVTLEIKLGYFQRKRRELLYTRNRCFFGMQNK